MTVYILLKNRDFIEGAGPMLFHKAFVNKESLESYVNSLKHGVYGWKPPEGKTFSECLWNVVEARIYKKYNPYGGWEGYEIVVVETE